MLRVVVPVLKARPTSAVLLAAVLLLCDIIGVATAVDLDIYIITASDISAATAQQLIPKLTVHKDISFRGYKALPEAALESSGEAANVVAELAYLNTIIDAKAASGKTTVLIWRPATVAMMSASLTNVAKAVANGVRVVYIESGPMEGSTLATIDGDPISAAQTGFTYSVTKHPFATQTVGSPSGGNNGLGGMGTEVSWSTTVLRVSSSRLQS